MAAYYRPEDLDYDSLLSRLVDQPSDTVRSLAVFLVGELKLKGLRARLEELRSEEPTLFVRQMLDHSLRSLTVAEERHEGRS